MKKCRRKIYLSVKHVKYEENSDEFQNCDQLSFYPGTGKYVNHYSNYNNLYLEGALCAIGNYINLPVIIELNFKKFIQEFYSACFDCALQKIEQRGKNIYRVTVKRYLDHKIQKIIWIERSYQSDKSVDVSAVRLMRKMLVKHKTPNGIIVTRNRLSVNALTSIISSRYNILFIDKILLKKAYTTFLRKSFATF